MAIVAPGSAMNVLRASTLPRTYPESQEHSVLVLEVALLDGVFQTVEERSAAGAGGYLGLIHLADGAWRHFADSGREYDRFAFFYRYVEISGHPQVLGVRHAALKILQVLEAVVPVGLIVPFGFVVKLHVEPRIALVEAAADSVGGVVDLGVDGVVGHYQGVGFAERKHRAEAECRG